jgi:hypothetical protein
MELRILFIEAQRLFKPSFSKTAELIVVEEK